MNMCKSVIIYMLVILLSHSGYSLAGEIFSDDFETGDIGQNELFSWGGTWDNVYVGEDPITGVATIPYADLYSMGFTYRAREDGLDSSTEERFKLNSRYPDIWMSYYIRVPDNYFHREQESSANNKWLAIWTDEYERQGITVVYELWPDTEGSSKMAYRWVLNGTTLSPHQGHTYIIYEQEDKGKWIHFVTHIKLASAIGKDDGVIQTWYLKEGDSVYTVLHNRTDAPLYADGASNGFNAGYLMGWSNSGFTEETTFYMDNFILSTEPLITLPSPPDNIIAK